MLKNLTIGARLTLLGLVAFATLAAIASIAIYSTYQARFEDRRETLHLLAQTAVTTIAGLKTRADAGEMTTEEAQKRALVALTSITYGKGNYFIVLRSDGVLLMHPTRQNQVGTNVLEGSDAVAKELYGTLIPLAMRNGEKGDFHTSMGRRPGSTVNNSPKMFHALQEPSYGWILASGLFVDDIEDQIASQARLIGLMALVAALILGGVGLIIARGITKPLKTVVEGLDGLADRDYRRSLDIPASRSEVGRIASAFERLRGLLLEAAEERRQNAERTEQAALARKEEMLALASRFENQIGDLVNGLGSASEALRVSASTMSSGAEETLSQASTVTAAASESSENTQTVAAATEELASSIQEISRQASHSNAMARTAVERVDETNKTVAALNSAALRVGDVVALITDIASQTNLLALNATIEAARAGEAGKGFAVVAGEVKSLAQQTAKATEDISRQIEDIQSVTTSTVQAISAIGESINGLSEVAGMIAAAVEEQNAATKEISMNIQRAEGASREVSGAISLVSEAARSGGETAADVLGAAEDLFHRNKELNTAVSDFVSYIRSAN
ncbi:methyl-accepting chemotaxis protein [Rhodospirillum rubrum]|uniref:Chemotaxis sensory transducer n=1 Tax=Rhodospirillum rubrum (strain ATCC 11170 / ATH 1.1.1 / DSM 467 / LMG 4362 / NCIMB 8255 / S1) TaxID=269796 RepID=Q2RRI5_RHORT|nr:methyl-accepting chemotaxis protein [Rhodospirillum rubrum]ABC23260.1 chemotaxis sensory transducer [Rhodospirillum rubrum ATCC 11170]AEO48992.1 chemotaxis sensory transducer [Rhodospirillum rubrum F11]MBK5954900.1 chemotaxis protein [Rhodospirillum rubrum]QXG79235.1 cache domain-containing protein [Rhodospirillum rubrum]HAQ00050.1 chemotaxis protein [Rhodospirillum rubrum]